MANDVPRMVKQLVRKVRRTVPEWRKLWKIVTILVGHNDVCNHTCDNTFLQGIGIDRKIVQKHSERTFVKQSRFCTPLFPTLLFS